ncbi:MAG: trypsin-like peptidase domain-containing protein [Candidatus Stygibacter australis]|nr:trypsin-like peptidase domain-containing protein [Candidatus Stygibacter australis]MDP8320926.1 trypsin-like peptidase domain-containing protein [Candidatus Stygibacter australis]
MRKFEVIIILIVVFGSLIILGIKDNDKKSLPELSTTTGLETAAGEFSTAEERLKANDELCESRHNAITSAIQIVSPAVVSVNVIKTQIVNRHLSPFDNPFFGFFRNVPYKREIKGIGSGVIFNDAGYIITNAHVVEGATQIKVILSDNRQFEGELIGLDSVHDIAIVKLKDGEDLPVAKLGTSCGLIMGEWAIAVGNPYGFLLKDSKPSVSVGVISALNRDFAPNEDGKIYKKMIQTDAAINPGNSGGPLVNVMGEVIGINSFIFSESGGSIGIGFAIPIDSVKKIADELIKYGKIRDIWYGFKVQEITPVIASYLGLSSSDGVLVALLDKNGPADKAGLKKGDIIIKINKYQIKTTDDAEIAVTDVSVGDKMNLEIIRDTKPLSIVIDAIEYK